MVDSSPTLLRGQAGGACLAADSSGERCRSPRGRRSGLLAGEAPVAGLLAVVVVSLAFQARILMQHRPSTAARLNRRRHRVGQVAYQDGSRVDVRIFARPPKSGLRVHRRAADELLARATNDTVCRLHATLIQADAQYLEELIISHVQGHDAVERSFSKVCASVSSMISSV